MSPIVPCSCFSNSRPAVTRHLVCVHKCQHNKLTSDISLSFYTCTAVTEYTKLSDVIEPYCVSHKDKLYLDNKPQRSTPGNSFATFRSSPNFFHWILSYTGYLFSSNSFIPAMICMMTCNLSCYSVFCLFLQQRLPIQVLTVMSTSTMRIQFTPKAWSCHFCRSECNKLHYS